MERTSGWPARAAARFAGALRPTAGLALLALAAAGLTGDAAAQASATARPSMGKTVKVAQGVYEVAVSEQTGTVYVASAGRGAGEVVALDAETLDTRARIDMADTPPFGLGINDLSQTLYTTNTRDGSVSVIDLKTNQVIRTLRSEVDTVAHLREVAVDEEANRIYVSSYGTEGVIWVIDGATNTIIDHYENVGEGSSGLALDAAAGRLYVTNIQGGDISVIDTGTGEVVNRFPAGGGRPTNAALDAEGNRLFVANQESGDVTVVDTRSGELLAAVPTGAGALGVRFNPSNGLVYVTNRQAGTVTVIDAADYGVVGNFETGTHPNTVVVDRTTNNAYVTNKARSGGRGAPPVDDPRGDTVTIIRP